MAEPNANNAEARHQDASSSAPKVRWDPSNLRSTYANVANVSSSREEVVLLFGINQAWVQGQPEITVQLTDRIILSPFTAKRLAAVLSGAIAEYEKRFGTLAAPDPERPGA